MERMKKKKRVRQRGRGQDYQDVKKKVRSREDLVGRDEKRMRGDEKGTDRGIKKKITD